jgi:hypothetical protein
MAQLRLVLVMAPVAVIAVVVAVALFAAVPRSRWEDPDAHVVDGYWLDAETVCPFEQPTVCVRRIDAAIESLTEREPAARVVATRLAEPANAYFDGSGKATILWASGCCSYHVAILEVADGTCRLIGVTCGPSSTDDGGAVERCFVQGDQIAATRVGQEPWLAAPSVGS